MSNQVGIEVGGIERPQLGYWNMRCLAEPIRLLLNFAGVDFEDYLPASVVAVLPALVAHVLVGSSLAELSTSGGDSSPALIALSAASALVLVQRLATAPERVK